jgi:hypothetical protein
MFAAEAVAGGGIPILEVTLTVPEAIRVIDHVVKQAPDVIVGAGQRWSRSRHGPVRGAERCRRHPGNPHPDRNHKRMEARARFCESRSLRPRRRRHLHSRSQSDVSPNTPRCGWRSEPTNGIQLYSRRRHRARYWGRTDPEGGYPTPAVKSNRRTITAVSRGGFEGACTMTGCRIVGDLSDSRMCAGNQKIRRICAIVSLRRLDEANQV